jgi:hypothetical protein
MRASLPIFYSPHGAHAAGSASQFNLDYRPLIAFRRGGHAMGMICYHSNASNGVFFFISFSFVFASLLAGLNNPTLDHP